MLFVGVALAMLTLHPNKQARYLFTILPVLLVLAESGAGRPTTPAAVGAKCSGRRWP